MLLQVVFADLPDGPEVEVVVIDDDLSVEDRAELHASLDRALDDSEAGRGMDAATSTTCMTANAM